MTRILALISFVITGLAATEAFAYIGPGAGISAIGSLVAFLGTVAMVILGFVWYPIKRLRQRFRSRTVQAVATADTGTDGE